MHRSAEDSSENGMRKKNRTAGHTAPATPTQSRLNMASFAHSPNTKSPLELETERLQREAELRKDYVTLPMYGVTVRFPFQPYKSQRQMMAKIVQALKAEQNALLESPTGSGKSLALLCASLSWQQYERARLEQVYVEEMALMQERIDQRKRDIDAQTALLASAAAAPHNLQVQPPQRVVTPPPEQAASDSNGQKASAAAAQSTPRGKPKYSTHYDDDDFLPVQPVARKSNSFRRTIVLNYDTSTADPPPSPSPGAGKERALPRSFDDAGKRAEYGSPSRNTARAPPQAPAAVQSPQPQNQQQNGRQPNVKVPIIYYGTRTHKQIAQIVRELKRNTDYRPNMTILGSRAHYCIQPKLKNKQNKDEECYAMLDTHSCIYGENIKREKYGRNFAHKVWDIEDLTKIGNERKGPYNYLVDPLIRSAMNIELKGNVIILDEAHNIEDVAREAASFEIDEEQLSIVRAQLTEAVRASAYTTKYTPLLHLVEAVSNWLYSHNTNFTHTDFDRQLNYWDADGITGFLLEIGASEAAVQLLQGLLTEARNESFSKGEEREHIYEFSNFVLNHLEGLVMILDNLIRDNGKHLLDYKLALIKRIRRGTPSRIDQAFAKEGWTYKIAFWCFNPAVSFSLLSRARSVILTSGTLSPMDSFTSELEAPFPIQLEADHVIGMNQTWAGVISVGPSTSKAVELVGTFQNVNTLAFQDAVGEAILRIVSTVPHGCLCFIPSYSMLDKLVERWKVTSVYKQINAIKQIFLEPRANSKVQFDESITQYYRTIDASVRETHNSANCTSGAIFFGVFRGKVSEGIDFTDERARCVICVGIPYPNAKDLQVQLKKTYNDKSRTPQRLLLSGNDWYEIQAFRAINQALGRCIRHRNDWGAIVFLEKRLVGPKYQRGLSKWVRPRISAYQTFEQAADSLSSFMQERQTAAIQHAAEDN
ncbi:hypothetical protein RI367_003215 [Sorochytrium milnesiophthora]